MPPHRILRYARTDSTNERAFAALASGEARDGDVHVAAEQTHGRGSRGRTWVSAPGEGLYASLIWRPPAGALEADPDRLPSPAAITMATGLAVRATLVELGAQRARLKWPNDVLLDGRKVAGILIEARGWSAREPIFVCGFGVNVAQRAFPDDLRRPATSLALEGLAIEPDTLLARLLPRLDATLARAAAERDARDALAAEFADAAGLRGTLRVAVGDREHAGELVTFGLDGLVLAAAEGRLHIALEHLTSVETG